MVYVRAKLYAEDYACVMPGDVELRMQLASLGGYSVHRTSSMYVTPNVLVLMIQRVCHMINAVLERHVSDFDRLT